MSRTPQENEAMIEAHLKDPAFAVFYNTIRSPETRVMYVGCLRRYMAYHRIEKFADLLSHDRKTIQANIITFLTAKRRELRAQTLSIYVSTLFHFYTYNDVTDINWLLIRGALGEYRRVGNDRGYTVQEIRTMLKHANVRKKVIVLLMASTGIRVGAIPSLTYGNLTPVDKLFKITVYQGFNEEYTTYCSVECALAINDYMNHRKEAGEDITKDSPLIRNAFESSNAKRPQPVTRSALNTLMIELLSKAGLRKSGNDRYARHDTMLNHAFRKFFETTLINNNVSPIIVDLLVGHKLKGTHSNYYRGTEEDLLKTYLTVVDKLTFNTENRLRGEIEELQQKLSKEGKLQAQIDSLTAQMNNIVAERYDQTKGKDPMFV